ncbi:hypothetical protein [Methylomonas koyamae]|nr:hypothetical protein [Methylomonas koyamae]
MSSQSSLSDRFKRPSQSIQAQSNHSMFKGHHATVDCPECHRIMVPRVITYYGQPTKSICPFCGATFARFPSGFKRFLTGSENRKLSLTVLRITTLITLGCMALLSLSDWLKLPDPIGLYVFYAAVIFGITCLAELLYQSIEFTAVKLSHESNYYWASLTALVAIAAIQNSSLLGYAGGFFMALLLRATISRLIQAL